MKLDTYKRKALKEDVILRIFYYGSDQNGELNENKLQRYLKLLLAKGLLRNHVK